ncbi:hypothetical protein GH714_006177 [Hevea brasiliensis]|uniref:Uncharacterized protein n=1 Tax=Hevea brasiliensis TaxID=3981 RepID=A0A6A6MC70_HEVBR|nr:hypothetical protein GH714_006177 [Hevea brasiliensis]
MKILRLRKCHFVTNLLLETSVELVPEIEKTVEAEKFGPWMVVERKSRHAPRNRSEVFGTDGGCFNVLSNIHDAKINEDTMHNNSRGANDFVKKQSFGETLKARVLSKGISIRNDASNGGSSNRELFQDFGTPDLRRNKKVDLSSKPKKSRGSRRAKVIDLPQRIMKRGVDDVEGMQSGLDPKNHSVVRITSPMDRDVAGPSSGPHVDLVGKEKSAQVAELHSRPPDKVEKEGTSMQVVPFLAVAFHENVLKEGFSY